jgi:hypothetical protein
MKDEEIRAAIVSLLKERGGSMDLEDFTVWISVKTGENAFILGRVVDKMKAQGEISQDEPPAESGRKPSIRLL